MHNRFNINMGDWCVASTFPNTLPSPHSDFTFNAFDNSFPTTSVASPPPNLPEHLNRMTGYLAFLYYSSLVSLIPRKLPHHRCSFFFGRYLLTPQKGQESMGRLVLSAYTALTFAFRLFNSSSPSFLFDCSNFSILFFQSMLLLLFFGMRLTNLNIDTLYEVIYGKYMQTTHWVNTSY